MRQPSRRERLAAAIARQPVDRVPYAFWRHFPAVDRNPAGLAQATLRFHERYGSDLVVLAPGAGAAVEAWGCVETEEPGPDGRRPCARCAVATPDDWRRIRALDPSTAPGYLLQLEAIVRMGFDRRIGDAPVLATVASPLSVAARLCGGRLGPHLREAPDLVAQAVEGITETLLAFVELVLAEGVSGVLFAVDAAASAGLESGTYARLGAPSDRRVLATARARGGLAVAHLEAGGAALADLAGMPVDVWSWQDRLTPDALLPAQRLVPGALLGGLDRWGTLRDGTPEQAAAQAAEAVARLSATGLVVGPGGPLPAGTPDATLAAVVQALGGPLRPILGVAR